MTVTVFLGLLSVSVGTPLHSYSYYHHVSPYYNIHTHYQRSHPIPNVYKIHYPTITTITKTRTTTKTTRSSSFSRLANHAHVSPYYPPRPHYQYSHPIVYRSKIHYPTKTITTTTTSTKTSSSTTYTNTTSISSFSNLASSLWSLASEQTDQMTIFMSCLTAGVEDIVRDIGSVAQRMMRFGELSGPAEIARETAGLLRLLAPLAQNTTWSMKTPFNCEIPAGFQSLQNLTEAVSEMSTKSGALLTFITVFLADLQPISARLLGFCTEDTNQFNRESITALGDMMGLLADLYDGLGDTETGEMIRYGQVYTDKVTVGLLY